jgi:RNA polymerase sigma-32 factor
MLLGGYEHLFKTYILKNWSVVKTGSTASQKALFFNLRKIKQQISDVSSEYMGQNEINKVSEILNVKILKYKIWNLDLVEVMFILIKK